MAEKGKNYSIWYVYTLYLDISSISELELRVIHKKNNNTYVRPSKRPLFIKLPKKHFFQNFCL